MSEAKSADELKQLGNEAFTLQEFDKAISLYSDAIKIDPKNHVFFSNRSACYAGKKEWSAAAEDAKECMKLDPTFIKGYYRLATAQIEMEKLDGAISTIKQGLNIDQKNGQLLRQLQTVKQLKKKLQARKKKEQQALTNSSNLVTQDPAINKELQELHGQYVQTLREHKTVEANITMAQREYRAHEITKDEIAKLPTTEDTRMYRSIGKMFMLSSRDDVNGHLENAMKIEKKQENDLTQKQAYLERRLKSQQQNIQELAPPKQ
mmetsp:Transcript_20038/g.22906  ORF Transcript_20038/g.22906 Transcript_20038/m.22906 type:complete len:263 (+) Transcript_20038:91-879(+)|eukprot:CAMPEP_0194146548 /NCGR_PEP_ID=MMETSP0152-20130528/20857_1 /TAXON_ID=1049557 /ORGANISM="Thalassiothrix antarctica, Strain L6-D1" /LENGTH=262 /DNA_ID=CAMNT_0038847093 /DNA_START=69 /DNA_END=857 /DNA_ORIENTATION=+